MRQGPDAIERDARETVQMWLSFASTIIWFAVTFTLAVMLDLPNSESPARVIPLGFAMLLVAATPWIAYRPLVRAAVRRRVTRLATRSGPSR